MKLNINGQEAPEVISFDCAILLQLKSGAKLAESGLPCSFRRRIIGLPLENLALNQVLGTKDMHVVFVYVKRHKALQLLQMTNTKIGF